VAYDAIEIAQEFFDDVRRVHLLGAGTPETSYYKALEVLFDRVGASLSPKVLALSQLANTGAGSPDFGLFAANQVQKGEPRAGQMPERGVVDVKSVADNSLFTGTPAQLSKYFGAYGIVLVTNLRAFQLVGQGVDGSATRLEGFKLRLPRSRLLIYCWLKPDRAATSSCVSPFSRRRRAKFLPTSSRISMR